MYTRLFVFFRTPPDEAGGGVAATGAPLAEGERTVAWLWSTHAHAIDSDEEGFRSGERGGREERKEGGRERQSKPIIPPCLLYTSPSPRD